MSQLIFSERRIHWEWNSILLGKKVQHLPPHDSCYGKMEG